MWDSREAQVRVQIVSLVLDRQAGSGQGLNLPESHFSHWKIESERVTLWQSPRVLAEMARHMEPTVSPQRCWSEPGHMWPIPVLTSCRAPSHLPSSPVGQKPQDLLVCLFGNLPATEAQHENLWPWERRGRATSRWGRG